MTADRERRILAARLIDHFQAGSNQMQNWIETTDDPLAASIFTAPLEGVTETILQECDNYEWDTVREEVEAQINGDVTQVESDLTRAEAATADFFIHQVHSHIHHIFLDNQEDMITPSLHAEEFEFDPIVDELIDGEDDAKYL